MYRLKHPHKQNTANYENTANYIFEPRVELALFSLAAEIHHQSTKKERYLRDPK